MNPEHYTVPFLLTLLTGDNGSETKARACQQLAIIGGPEAVPALAALLADEEVSVCARSALEAISSPTAGAALLEALPRLTGRCLTGAIDSLGVRREVQAVPALQTLVGGALSDAATEALAALGKIATPEALATIQKTLRDGPAALRLPAAHAALTAANVLVHQRANPAVNPLLQAVIAATLPAYIKSAARVLLVAPLVKQRTVRLFDGRSFAGWEGDLTWYRIANGAVIAGRLDRPIPQNEFLSTLADYQDFELRLKVRLVSETGNAGVQFRSQRVPGSREMIGYQADVSADYWGSLYDESRRRTFLVPHPDKALLSRLIRPDAWNDYVIRCEGARIRLWLNSQLTADFIETGPAVPRSGKIGLQIHKGGPSEAWYKDIELDELAPATPTEN